MIKQLSTIAASLMLATAAYGQTTTPTTPPAAKTAPGAVDQNGASMTSPPATVTPRATTASPVHLTDEQAKVWIVSVSRTPHGSDARRRVRWCTLLSLMAGWNHERPSFGLV